MSDRDRTPLPLLLLLLLLIPGGCTPSREEAPLPSIFLISIDTLRADRLPVYGYGGVATPAIDALRRDGVLFERAYTSAPLTLPAHASLLTGQPPYTHGVRDNVGYRLEAGERATASLPRWLKSRGYATGAGVSAYVLRGETGLGPLFDHYDDGIAQGGDSRALGQVQRPGSETLEGARRWIRAQQGNPAGAPLFFLLHLFEPHTPYDPPEPFRGRYADPYDGEIAAADALVGEFLEFLKAEGLYEGALIILLADHGEGLGDHGEAEHGIFLYPETIQVPLVVKLPGAARAGTSVAVPAQLLDIFPTIAALVGGAAPELPGADLFQLEDGAGERRLYSESYYARLHLGWSELRSLVDARYQFIQAPTPELYDLVEDPGATRNILTEQRRVYRAMEEALGAHDGALAAPEAVADEEAAKLAALGYLTAPTGRAEGPLPDPKDALPALETMRRAFALGAEGRCEAAVPLYQDLLERFPGMLDARVELAACLRALARPEEALAAYRDALTGSPQAADGILLKVAEIQLELGRLDEAEEHARAALSGVPGKAHGLLARIALERGEGAAALAAARAAVAAEAVPRPESILTLARAQLATGEATAALDALDTLGQRLSPEEAASLPWFHFLRGDALARLGRDEAAEKAFRREIRAFPQNSPAFANLAVLLAAQQRFGEIEPTLQAMVSAHPVAATYALAAATAERLGDAAGAARWRTAAQARPPGSP